MAATAALALTLSLFAAPPETVELSPIVSFQFASDKLERVIGEQGSIQGYSRLRAKDDAEGPIIEIFHLWSCSTDSRPVIGSKEVDADSPNQIHENLIDYSTSHYKKLLKKSHPQRMKTLARESVYLVEVDVLATAKQAALPPPSPGREFRGIDIEGEDVEQHLCHLLYRDDGSSGWHYVVMRIPTSATKSLQKEMRRIMMSVEIRG